MSEAASHGGNDFVATEMKGMEQSESILTARNFLAMRTCSCHARVCSCHLGQLPRLEATSEDGGRSNIATTELRGTGQSESMPNKVLPDQESVQPPHKIIYL
jgi:hypothetical protein